MTLRPPRYGAMLALMILWSSTVPPAQGGELEVNSVSAYSGAYGLETTLSPCTPAQLTIGPTPPTVTGSHIGCTAIVATGVQVLQPGAVFKAGNSVELGEGFSVGAGAELTVVVDSMVDSPFAFVQDHSPSNSVNYMASFFTNLANLDLADGDQLEHFVGYSEEGDVLFRLSFKHNVALNEDRLVLAVRKDDGTYEETPWGEEQVVPDSYNEFSVDWRASAGSGKLLVALNLSQGGAYAGLSGIDNDTARLAYVRWGTVGGQVGSTSGSLYLDDFSSLP